MNDDTLIPHASGTGSVSHRHGFDPNHERELLIERDLSDVYLLMDYLSGRPDRCISDLKLENPTDPTKPLGLVEEVCKIRWPLPDEPIAHATQAAILFKARDKLNQMANPANGATIAYTVLVLGGAANGLRGWLASWLRFIRPPGNARSRADLARAAYPNLVRSANGFRRWITLLQFMLLGGLMVTSLLSWNVASGKLILQRINQLDAQAIDIGRTLDASEDTTTAAPPPSPDAASGSGASADLPAFARFCHRAAVADRTAGTGQSEIAIRREQICATARLVIERRAIADGDLVEWSAYWGWLRNLSAWLQWEEGGVPAVIPAQRQATVGLSIEQWSADLITVLGNFVLPMLYGFLGATTAVVLGIQSNLRESLLAPRDLRMSQVQLVLGIIVGACIGLFMSPSGPDAGTAAGSGGAVTTGSSVALSASALSFLAGFGVESVFKRLQSMLQAMFGSQPAPTPAAPPAHVVQTHIVTVMPGATTPIPTVSPPAPVPLSPRSPAA